MEKDWLALMNDLTDLTKEITHYSKPLLDKTFPEYSLSELELIEHIATLPNPNVTLLATASFMTRGAISKGTDKLIELGLIERYQDATNKKKVFFRLTATGATLHNRHQALHAELLARDTPVFQKFSDAEFAAIQQFIQLYREHLATL